MTALPDSDAAGYVITRIAGVHFPLLEKEGWLRQ